MSPPDPNRLVLIISTLEGGQAGFRIGAGFFVTEDLVLTGSHVVPEVAKKTEVRVTAGGARHQVLFPAVWRDAILDAVLLRVKPGLPGVPPVRLATTQFTESQTWESAGYPLASVEHSDLGDTWTTKGLYGKLLAGGGEGGRTRKLDLNVESPPREITQWQGISGAPVFVDNLLAGIIKEVPRNYDESLSGVPADLLFANPGFRLAMAPEWLHWPSGEPWVLLLRSEHDQGVVEGVVQSAIKRFNKVAAATNSVPFEGEPVVVDIVDALESPERWLALVKALCAAPVVIADLTGFEPGVMLVLGVRAVVRRGVTITSTTDPVDEAHLSHLPFNIQETKLICHGVPKDKPSKHPADRISEAIRDGLQELASHPNYLDLPAFDAVRSADPGFLSGAPPALDAVLVLCPFMPEYGIHWQRLSYWLGIEDADREIVRMLEISSPRLVGQALYERIRWVDTCIVDWAFWRPNVFFEFGVRIACSEIGPLCIIDESGADVTKVNDLKQKAKLLKLFGPTPYNLEESVSPLHTAFENHEKDKKRIAYSVPDSQLAHNTTYRQIVDVFDYRHEHITLKPHQLLRLSAETETGKDPQSRGSSQVLFSTNPGFAKELESSVRERWIAAWYYARYRYRPEEIKADGKLREELKSIGENAQQAIQSDDQQLRELKGEIVDWTDELDQWAESGMGSENANAD